MSGLAQLVGGKLAQVFPQLCLTPVVKDFPDVPAVNAKPTGNVIQRSLAWLFPVIIDLHSHGTRLTVTRPDLDPE
jgi:hypothetical protein